jgi:hypothetical protein
MDPTTARTDFGTARGARSEAKASLAKAGTGAGSRAANGGSLGTS